MSDEKQCTPIPCPEFASHDFGGIQPIAWNGIDITVMEANDDFTSQTPFAQAESLWETLIAHAALTRKTHRYSDDTAVIVHLPDNPALAEIFAVVKARAIHGSPIMIQLASEEVAQLDEWTMTPEEQAEWDNLSPEEQLAILQKPLPKIELPAVSVRRGGIPWPSVSDEVGE
jgi:hypothetical protein